MSCAHEVTQSCLTFCNPMDCSPSGNSVHGDSPGRNTAVGWYALLHGIFQTEVSCTAGEFFTEPPGKPKNTGVGSLSLLQKIFPTQESNQGFLHCRWILYQLSYQGSLYIYIYLFFFFFPFPVLMEITCNNIYQNSFVCRQQV